MANQIQKKTDHRISLLRIIACLAVIILHTSAEHLYNVPYGSFESIVMNFGHGATRFAVTVFFLISGSLYLDKKYEISDKKKYIRKIMHFAFLYVFYAVFYSACALIFGRQFEGGILSTVISIFEHALTSPKFHLWYLPAYIGTLLAIPILKRFIGAEDAHEKDIIGYAVLLLFASMIIKSAAPFKVGYIENILELLNTVFSSGFIGWTGVCLLGYYIKNHYDGNRRIAYTVGIVLFALALIASYWLYGRIETRFYDNLTIQTTLFAAVLFDYFTNVLQLKLSDKVLNTIDNLSGLTLGIYLIHPFLLNVFNVLGFNSLMFNSLIAIIIVAVVTFAISALIVSVVKKIPVLSKLVQ